MTPPMTLKRNDNEKKNDTKEVESPMTMKRNHKDIMRSQMTMKRNEN